MLSKNKIAKPHLPPLRRKKEFLVTLEARGVGKGPAGSTEHALEHARGGGGGGGRSQSVSSLLLPCLPPKAGILPPFAVTASLAAQGGL